MRHTHGSESMRQPIHLWKWHWRVLGQGVITVLALERPNQRSEVFGWRPSALILARKIEGTANKRVET
jgi:hypothetical protein